MALTYFHHTKDFAAFLLDRRLGEAAEKYLKLVRDLDLPLLKMFAHLTEEALFDLTKQSLEKFLKGIVDDTAWQDASAYIAQYKANQIPGIASERVEVSDIVLVYSSRKQLLVKFLPEYTQDTRLITDIFLELEKFFLGLVAAPWLPPCAFPPNRATGRCARTCDPGATFRATRDHRGQARTAIRRRGAGSRWGEGRPGASGSLILQW